MCYLAAICCDPFSEHVGDVCLPLACSFPLLVCPVVLGTQGIKQQGFRLPVLRIAVPVSACTGVGWGTASACSEHYVVATCMRVSLVLAVLLCCPGIATCCEQTFSPVFGKIWTSAPCRSHQEQHLFCGRGVWHAAGRISAGTCLQCAGIRVQKGVVCVFARLLATG